MQEGDPAEVKIDTFNFTKYGLLQGKVISVSADSIQRDKPANQAAPSEKTAAASRTSEPTGQELLYWARIALDKRRCRSRTGRSISRPAWP